MSTAATHSAAQGGVLGTCTALAQEYTFLFPSTVIMLTLSSSILGLPDCMLRFTHYSLRLYSSISPGWQSRISHIASYVEKRIALILPVLIFDKLTLAIPTFPDNSFREIFLSAIMRSRRRIIGIVIPPIKSRRFAFAKKYRT